MTSGEGGQSAVSSCAQIDPRIVMAGLFLIALIPLTVTPVLPLIDFYNHLARFYVLAHLDSNPLLRDHYQADWALLPDIGLDVIATPMLRFVPPLIAGKLIVAGILALLYSGVLYFHRILTGQRSFLVAVLLLPLLYSYILNWGFVNFLLGLGFAFWAAGWWIAHRKRPWLSVPISSVLALLIFLTHGVAFTLYGVLVALVEVGLFLNAPSRKAIDLARSLSLVALQAVIPIIMFLSWERGLPAEVALTHAADTHKTILNALYPHPRNMGLRRLSTVLRVEEGPAYWFDILTFFIQLAIVTFLIWRRRIDVVRPARVLIPISVLMIGLMPNKLFGVDYIADRIPLFAACCMLGALSVGPAIRSRESRVLCGILIITTLVRIGAVAMNWHGYAQSYREFSEIAVKIPRGSLALGVAVGAGRHETDVPRCEMYGPLLITQFGQIGPSFSFKGQHPLLLKGRLEHAVGIMQANPITAGEDVNNYHDYMTIAGSAGFDYLLVCNSHLLKQAVPSNLIPVAQTAHFALLRTPD